VRKILLVTMMYDYGIKKRGFSYEYYNFYQCLKNLGENVQFFDFLTLFQERGKEQMNQELFEVVRREKPDLVFFTAYKDQFISDVLDTIKKHTTTLCYLYDDPWRMDYSKFWARHCTFVVTSDINGIQRFGETGYHNVIYSPFSCNHLLYTKQDLPKLYDVSFVGGFHPFRNWLLRKIRSAGIQVFVWGGGWNRGHIQIPRMIKIFNQSRINLNLSNCVSWDLRYLLSSPRAIKNTLTSAKAREMVKFRQFEINMCGAFQLSYYSEGLEHYYEIGKEIAVYLTVDDLIEKIHYYLKHDDVREEIAMRGYRRSLVDHTMEKRLRNLLREIGQNKYVLKK